MNLLNTIHTHLLHRRSVISTETGCRKKHAGEFYTGLDNTFGFGACQPQFPTESDCLAIDASPDCNMNDYTDRIQEHDDHFTVGCTLSLGAFCWASLHIRVPINTMCFLVYTNRHGDVAHVRFQVGRGQWALQGVLKKVDTAGQTPVYVSCGRSQRLLVFTHLDGHNNSSEEQLESHQGLAVDVIVIPLVSRASLYRSYCTTVRALRTVRLQQALISDFSLHQAVGTDRFINFLDVLVLGETVRNSSLDGPDALLPAGVVDNACDLATVSMQMSEGDQASQFQHAQMTKFLCRVGFYLAQVNNQELLNTNGLFNPWDFVTKFQLSYLEYALRGTFAKLSVSVIHHTDSKEIDLSHNAIDLLISNHLRQVVRGQQTIMFILSNRGAVYGQYPELTSYGRLEQDNPLFLMIVPEKLRHILPVKALDLLDVNQHRLVTVADIHLTLMSLVNLADTDHATGAYRKNNNLTRSVSLLHGQVPYDRSCSSAGVGQPHMCLCKGEWVEVANDTLQVGLAEVAIAGLNNIVHKQAWNFRTHMASFSHSPTGNCGRLVGISFRSVHLRRLDNAIRTMFIIHVRSEQGLNSSANKRSSSALITGEQFRVIVDTVFDGADQEMHLIYYARIMSEMDYRSCADPNVDLDLCICTPGHRKYTYTTSDLLRQIASVQFGVHPVVVNIHHVCLFLIIRNYQQSMSFYAANLCKDRRYRVILSIYSKYAVRSGKKRAINMIEPLQKQFLLVAMQASYYRPALKLKYKTLFTYELL